MLFFKIGYAAEATVLSRNILTRQDIESDYWVSAISVTCNVLVTIIDYLFETFTDVERGAEFWVPLFPNEIHDAMPYEWFYQMVD